MKKYDVVAGNWGDDTLAVFFSRHAAHRFDCMSEIRDIAGIWLDTLEDCPSAEYDEDACRVCGDVLTEIEWNNSMAFRFEPLCYVCHEWAYNA